MTRSQGWMPADDYLTKPPSLKELLGLPAVYVQTGSDVHLNLLQISLHVGEHELISSNSSLLVSESK